MSTTLVEDEMILITLVIGLIEDETGEHIGVTVRQLRDLVTARRLPGVRLIPPRLIPGWRCLRPPSRTLRAAKAVA